MTEAAAVAAPLAERACAKVNLTLRVIRRRADGYHDLDSLVVFARTADELRLDPEAPLGLTVSGPTAAAAGGVAGNLVLKAARAAADRIAPLQLGHFTLAKQLPVAAGLGGGSADAAAALRLLARTNALPLDDPRLLQAARATGADVPVCLDPRPRRMSGIGDVLSPPLELPDLPAVLVNPGVAVPTKDIFAALDPAAFEQAAAQAPVDWRGIAHDSNELIAAVVASANDLEPVAIRAQPVIADVLRALRAFPACRLARMSGSGATCFAIFERTGDAAAAAQQLTAGCPGWWVTATSLGSGVA